MREYSYLFDKGLAKGLRATAKNPRNSQALVESKGMFVEYGSLQSLPAFSDIDISTLGVVAFPYPQVFVLYSMTLVCTATAIYQLVGSTLTLLIGSLPGGVTWSCADFATFILLTNGKVGVRKDGASGVWSSFVDTEGDLPMGICYCDVNGQLLIGGPGVVVPSADI